MSWKNVEKLFWISLVERLSVVGRLLKLFESGWEGGGL